MVLHIACGSCLNLRTVTFVPGFVTSAGNRCCFCGVKIENPGPGFEFSGSEITCGHNHEEFGKEEVKKEEEEVVPEPKDTLVVKKK